MGSSRAYGGLCIDEKCSSFLINVNEAFINYNDHI